MHKKIEKILEVIYKKDSLNWGKEWTESSLKYLDEMEKEIHEVRTELLKKDNSVYLEDELCDLIWDYLNMIHNLNKENPDITLKKILKKCHTKFKQRIDMCSDGVSWADVKEKQKKILLKQHIKKYGK